MTKGLTKQTQTTTQLIREWSIDRNLHTADPTKQALKLGEEFGELFEGLAKGNEELTKDAVGDMYVVLTILTQQLGIDIEDCIEIAYDEIKDRKGRMVEGVFVKEADLPEEEGYTARDFLEAKAEEYEGIARLAKVTRNPNKAPTTPNIERTKQRMKWEDE